MVILSKIGIGDTVYNIMGPFDLHKNKGQGNIKVLD